MKYTKEFRDRKLVLQISRKIETLSKQQINLMEVCGGHTNAIHRFGLHEFLPANISLLSGPGCPVCVSGQGYVDQAIKIGRIPGVLLATYGDLIRVPGSSSSLEKERVNGIDIRIVYSALDALDLARVNPDKEVVFLGIGFETTAPASGAAVLMAEQQKIRNFSLLSAHKIMPPALEVLAGGDNLIHGFIAPGHVSAITGYRIYRDLVEKYQRAVVISGFEPADILMSILMLVRQIESGKYRVDNEYRRVVKSGGNKRAQEIINEVFALADADWRGLGRVLKSGLVPRERFSGYDAGLRFNVRLTMVHSPVSCICGEILKGKKKPLDCALFSGQCTPENPVGACMVSSEGACAIYYKYRKDDHE